ncbi:MAG: hypothetical protein E3J64_02045, partial [Anaerolineales bacterium]
MLLLAPGPQSRPWGFDPLSAIIGAGIAVLLFGLVRVLRQAIAALWESIAERAKRARGRLSASGEDRYLQRVAQWANFTTVDPDLAPLHAVFVEPELLTPVRLPTALSEVEPDSEPHRGIRIEAIMAGHDRLAILGPAGAGRTSLLAYLALELTRLRMQHGDQDGVEGGPADESRLPLYALLPAIEWEWLGGSAAGEQETEAGAEPDEVAAWEIDVLVSAAIEAVDAKKSLAGPLRQCLEEGQAVVLLDDWSELSPQQQLLATGWLAQLVEILPGNIWLVAASTRGYAPLAEAGFVPVRVLPWDAGGAGRLAERWSDAAEKEGEEGAATLDPSADLQRAAQLGSLPFDLALRAMVFAMYGEAPPGRAALYDIAFDLRLPQETQPWLRAACRDALGRLAQQLQDEGRSVASWAEIELAIEEALAYLEDWPAGALTEARTALIGPQALLRRVGSDRYSFAHPQWRTYLAARRLVDLGHEALMERLDDSRWSGVMSFCAGLTDVAPLVAAWLAGPDDLFQARLRAVGSWIREAPASAAWIGGAMALLARSFLAPRSPLSLRISLAEALAMSEAPGVGYLFRKPAEHADPEVRLA